MLCTVLASPKVFAADTTLPVLDLGRGRTETGRLWCYAVDDSPWNDPSQPMAAYVFSDDRMNERLAAHLSGFRGVLQVDPYIGFEALAGSRSRSLGDAGVLLVAHAAALRGIDLRPSIRTPPGQPSRAEPTDR